MFTVIDAVAQFDLSGFEAGYRADGRGRRRRQPAADGGLLLIAYCDG